MPMIPAWAISLILTFLQKSGFDAWAEKMAIKLGWKILQDVTGLKTFHAPEDFPEAPPSTHAQGQKNSNINQ